MSFNKDAKTSVAMIAEIARAVKENRFLLYAQEIRSLNDVKGNQKQYEILIRMVNEKGEIYLPKTFIYIAEHHDLITKIDEWVLHEVLLEKAAAIKQVETIHVALNLSVCSINKPHFIDFLMQCLHQTPLDRNRIGFEITETVMVNNLDQTGQLVRKLQCEGCKVALDDFGTGFSSYNYLKHCPVDFVKIDGGFIADINESEKDKIIVKSIHELAHHFGAKTIAESVESNEIITTLQKMGIDYGQGYEIGPPILLSELINKGRINE